MLMVRALYFFYLIMTGFSSFMFYYSIILRVVVYVGFVLCTGEGLWGFFFGQYYAALRGWFLTVLHPDMLYYANNIRFVQ